MSLGTLSALILCPYLDEFFSGYSAFFFVFRAQIHIFNSNKVSEAFVKNEGLEELATKYPSRQF